MKTIALTLLIFLTTITVHATTYYWISLSPANWTDPSNWSTTLGGPGGAGVPGVGDDVVFNAGGINAHGNCTLTGNVTINSITTINYIGTIDLGANSLTYTSCSLGSGTLTGGSLLALTGGTTELAGMAVNSPIDGTQAVLSVGGTIGGNISLKITAELSISNATINGTVYLEFSGTISPGITQSVFNQALTVINKSGVTCNLSSNNYKQAVMLIQRGNSTVAPIAFITSGDEVYESTLTIRMPIDSKTIKLTEAGTSSYANIYIDSAKTTSVLIGDISNGGNATISGQVSINRTTGLNLALSNCTFPNAARISSADPNTTFTSSSSTYNNGLRVQSRFIHIIDNTLSGYNRIDAENGGDIQTSTFTDGATLSLLARGTQDFTLSDNTYGGPTTFVRSSTANIKESGTETFKQDLTAIDSSLFNTGRIQLQGTITFQGNVSMINTSSSVTTTIQIGGLVSSSSTLAAGKAITLADKGAYSIGRLTQAGTESVNWTLNSASLTVANSTFNGPVTLSAPTLTINTTTFNNTALITFTGNGTSTSGGNTFNNTAQVTCNGTGTLRFGNTADTYNSQVTFTSLQGTLQPAYNATSSFKGNVIVESTGGAQVVFGSNTNGRAQFNGTGNQSITMTGSTTPVFNRVTINKTTGSFDFNAPLTIGVNMTLTNGIVTATSAAPVIFNNAATTSGASSISFVDGPVRKIGNQAFTFPVGDATDGVFRSIAISAPSNTTDAFTAEFIRGSHGHTDPTTFGSGLVTVNNCEFWTLDRTAGSSNVTVTIGWNTTQCAITITDINQLSVARWDGTQWVNEGNGATTGNTSSGTVTTAGTVSSFSPFALASTSMVNPLPIELASFSAAAKDETVVLNWTTASEHHSNYFVVERSADLKSFESIGEISAAGVSTQRKQYSHTDAYPMTGQNYYRLKFVDADGSFSYSKVQVVDMMIGLSVFPNPSNGVFNLNQQQEFTVLDATGIVRLESDKQSVIDLTSAPAGVYYLITRNGERRKLVKTDQ